MASEKQTKDAYEISEKIDEVTALYITLLAEQIGSLTGESSAVIEYEIAKKNIAKIRKKMSRQLKQCEKLTVKMLNKYGADAYYEMAKFYKARGIKQLPYKKNMAIRRQLDAVARTTLGTMRNISNTTVMDANYRRAIDRAIIEVTSGRSTAQTAIDRIMREATDKGQRVVYASGYERRMDSAVRQNVLDGVRSLNKAINHECAKEFGADGVLIHPHGLCAEDHLEYQGKEYTTAEFEAIQSDLDRPFGEWNCQHEIEEIVIGVSSNPYSQEELQEIADYSTEEIDLGNGQKMSRYQCSQKMREQETRIRDSKWEYMQAKQRFESSFGEQGEAEMRRFKRKIQRQEATYNGIADKAGLKTKPYRAKVVGFKY